MIEITGMIDEEMLEAAYWGFDKERKTSGAERDAFKHKVRQLLRAHMQPLALRLAEAEVYVRAYKCQCDAPEGIPGASRLLRRIGDVLAHEERA